MRSKYNTAEWKPPVSSYVFFYEHCQSLRPQSLAPVYCCLPDAFRKSFYIIKASSSPWNVFVPENPTSNENNVIMDQVFGHPQETYVTL